MSAYILCRGVDGGGDPMNYQRGYPVNVSATPQLYAATKQVPPNFWELEVTDATVGEVQAYCEEWWRRLDYEFVSHDFANDVHILRVFCDPTLVSSSGLNALTREQVEQWLNRWAMAVTAASLNSVTFSASVTGALFSDGFWGRSVVLIDFSEMNYDSATGIHRIQADYSYDPQLSQADPIQIADFVTRRGATVVSMPTNKVRFDIGRDAVVDLFKSEVKEALDSPVFRRKFYFGAGVVDAALANAGRLQATKAEVVGYIRNRLAE